MDEIMQLIKFSFCFYQTFERGSYLCGVYGAMKADHRGLLRQNILGSAARYQSRTERALACVQWPHSQSATRNRASKYQLPLLLQSVFSKLSTRYLLFCRQFILEDAVRVLLCLSATTEISEEITKVWSRSYLCSIRCFFKVAIIT